MTAASSHPAGPPAGWLRGSVSRQLTAGLMVAMLVSALVLVALAQSLHRREMAHQQEAGAVRMGRVFEASLQNAMLQRDLPGMAGILAALGQAPGVQRARLLEPHGTVRFASAIADVGVQAPEALAGLCLNTGCSLIQPRTSWVASERGGGARALRLAYPIANQQRCQQCHGSTVTHPVNGVLLVDFDPPAAPSLHNQWIVPLAGLAALLAFAGIMAWTLRRQVTLPLQRLADGAQRLAQGQLDTRVALNTPDELGRVGKAFDDMGERLKTLVDSLQNQRNFLQTLIDAMPDPVLVIGADYRIRMANRAYSDMLAIAPDAIVGKTCHAVGRGLSEPCPSTLITCPVAETRRRQRPVRSMMALRRTDGEPVDVDIEAAPLAGHDGELLTVEVLRPLDRAVRFSQEQRLSTIGLLANGVAHEIHNPLASIRLALQASLRGLNSGDMNREELIEYLRIVDHEIDRCVVTTQRLLQMSAVPNPALEPVPLEQAVDDVLALLVEECRTRGVTVSRRIEPSGARVQGDPAELRQVLVNLIHNALHATSPGGFIEIAGEPLDDGEYQIAVTDNGCGIPLQDQALIFMPFFSHRADGQRGTGLGLAISKAIVERFGGSISVRSQPAQGATFVVRLPCAQEGVAA